MFALPMQISYTRIIWYCSQVNKNTKKLNMTNKKLLEKSNTYKKLLEKSNTYKNLLEEK